MRWAYDVWDGVNGIEIPSSTIRLVTEKHAYKISRLKKPEANNEKILVSQTDGCLVPIVEIDPLKRSHKGDARKGRKTGWKEVKLSFARGKNKVKRFMQEGSVQRKKLGKRCWNALF